MCAELSLQWDGQNSEDCRDILEIIINASGGELFIKDVQGVYLFVNDFFCEKYTIKRDTVIGRNDYAIFSAETAIIIRANDLRIIQSQVPETIIEKAVIQGKQVTYRTVKTPLLDKNGDVNGICGVAFDITRQMEIEEERDSLAIELQKALNDLKMLQGTLPICSFCKKVRDENGRWLDVETYIRQHSEAEVSHGICPDCMEKHYPEA